MKLPLELTRPFKIENREAIAWAPSNIALVKYWGKRDSALNLPTHGSLSLSLGDRGTRTKLIWDDKAIEDSYFFNGQLLLTRQNEATRLREFLDLFRPKKAGAYQVWTENNIPTAAGLASSASGFAALVKALNLLHGLNLDRRQLSILARLGSGSASRSLFEGFVTWHEGQLSNGEDSYSEPLEVKWPQLQWLIYMPSLEKKPISSREAMKRTSQTCPWFSTWVDSSRKWLEEAKEAVYKKDFTSLGLIMESSSLMMHASMMSSYPAFCYWKPETLEMMGRIERARKDNIECYFTMDAGPSVKVLFQEKDREALKERVQDLAPLLWVDPWLDSPSR